LHGEEAKPAPTRARHSVARARVASAGVAERAEIVVVGAGIMGAATAYALTRAGHEPVVLEQFEVGHMRGSSHGRGRIFRFVYDDPRWVAQAQRALPLWRELEAETGEAILRTTGSLDLGPGTDVRAAALAECDVEFELLDGADVWAPLRIERGTPALVQRDGGVLDAARAQQAFLRGIRARERAPVTAIEDGRVRLDGTTIEAQAVVVTAGAWVARLLEPLGISPPVTPTRESVAYFPLAAPDGLPTIIDWCVPDGYDLPRPGVSVYALPGPDGLKAGVHRSGPPTDPEEEGLVDAETVRCSRDWVARYVEGADPEPSRTETCLYTNMPDESFVVERQGRVVVGSPCSGHGFKFAPLIGRELASLAIEALA
jgi:monomeric sarcosine oxidase